MWPLYVLAFGLATTSALQRPSREALMPRTVRHDELVAANALNSFGMQAGLLAGPGDRRSAARARRGGVVLRRRRRRA